MDGDEPWDILWFGAFETTAFITAILVGLFSFISDPTGRQDAQDASEIRVFYDWRRAIVLIGLDMLLKVFVLAVQWAKRRPSYTIFWTLALMAVPWAPLLDKVVASILAWGSVRTLMRSRVIRSEVSCILREYLRMGHPRLSTTALSVEVTGEAFLGPEQALQSVMDQNEGIILPDKGYRERVERLREEVRIAGASWVVTNRTSRYEIPVESRFKHRLNLMCRRLDLWMRCWTGTSVTLLVDPFSPGVLSRPEGAVAAAATSDTPIPATSATIEAKRTYILDKLDDHRGGHTMSQMREQDSLPRKLCQCCNVAARAAVEAFLESSSRAHVNVHARAWLADTHIDWSGQMEGVVDAMWEAAFVGQAALRVEDGEADEWAQENIAVPQVPANPTAASRKLLVLLFLVARSVLGTCGVLEGVARHIQARLHSSAYWNDYWSKVVGLMAVPPAKNQPYAGWIDGIKDSAMREVTVAEMKTLVRLLSEHPVQQFACIDRSGVERVLSSFCCSINCNLSTHTTMVVRASFDV